MKIEEVTFPVRVWQPGDLDAHGMTANIEASLRRRIRDSMQGRAPPIYGIKDDEDRMYRLVITENFRIEVELEEQGEDPREREEEWRPPTDPGPPPEQMMREIEAQFIAPTLGET